MLSQTRLGFVILVITVTALADSPVATWKIDELLSDDRVAKAVEIEIREDPVYFEAKRYLAAPLSAIVAAEAAQLPEEHLSAAVVVFDCSDDYASQMTLERFLSSEAWIAFCDLDAPEGESWINGRRGPSPAKMGRAYVIWPKVDPSDRCYTWPYAVEAVRLVVEEVGSLP